MCRIVAGVFERRYEQSLTGIGVVACKLAHLIGHAAVGVFIGYGEYLVGLQRTLQRNVSQGRIDGVFRGREQSGTFEFFVVASAHKSAECVKHRGGSVDVSGGGIGCRHGRIFRVSAIGGNGAGCAPERVGEVAHFAQVGQGDDVAGIVGGSSFVGHPYLHAVDGDAAHEIGQGGHPGIISIAEIMGEKEVSVFFIVGHVDFEGCELHAAARGYVFGG